MKNLASLDARKIFMAMMCAFLMMVSIGVGESAAADKKAPVVTQEAAGEIAGLMHQQVMMLTNGDYTGLQNTAAADLRKEFTKEVLDQGKMALAPAWGNLVSFGRAYISTAVENGAVYYVGEMAVGYENVSVIYRCVYNKDGKLVGFYIR